MSQVSIIDIEGNNPQIPTRFDANVGFAIPIGNVLEIFGDTVPAGSIPVQTVGSGNNITTKVQLSQAIASTDATKVGLAAFKSTDFTVDVNGFVSLSGGSQAIDSFSTDVSGPVLPDVNGNVAFTGASNVFSNGSVANTMRLNLQGTNHALYVGRGPLVASAQLAIGTNGQVLIAATGADPAFSTITSSDNSISFTLGPNSLNMVVSGLTDLHTAKYIVNAAGTSGTGANFSTITAANAAASSGETIFIMPGTYTENITLKAGVHYTAFNGDGVIGNVVVNGTLTMTAAGTSVVSGVRLLTNAAPCVVVSGANAASVILVDLVIACNGSTALSLTSSNASSSIQLYDCTGDIQTVATAFFASSSAGTFLISDSNFSNSISSTTASTISAGSLKIDSSTINFPITSSGTGSVDIQYNVLDTSSLNTTSLTIGGSGTNRSFHDTIRSGTASAISISQSLTTSVLTVNSSNANAITGAGTILYGLIEFTGSSSTINTSTQTALISQLGSLKIRTPIVLTTPVPVMRDSTTGEIGVGPVSGFTWTDVTGATQALLVQNGYITDRGGGVVYTLPATASLGDTIKFVGKLGLATITPNANQQILIGSASGTVGVTGTAVANNLGDTLEIICITSGASTVWRADSVIGTWTLN